MTENLAHVHINGVNYRAHVPDPEGLRAKLAMLEPGESTHFMAEAEGSSNGFETLHVHGSGLATSGAWAIKEPEAVIDVFIE